MSSIDNRFIDVIETGREFTRENWARTSTLLITKSGDDLQVIGELPHGYRFKPLTAIARNRMVDWLNSLEF